MGVSVVVVCVIVVTAGCVQCTVQCTVYSVQYRELQLGGTDQISGLAAARTQSVLYLIPHTVTLHHYRHQPPTLSTQSYISLKNAFR